jgi:hypothetical protein
MTFFRAALIAVVSWLAVSSTALAVEPPGAPIAKAFPYLSDYLTMPAAQRDRFRLVYFIRGKDKKPTPKIELVRSGNITPVRLGPNGRVMDVPDLALLRSDARFVATPKGQAAIGMRVEPILPRTTSLDAAMARESVTETTAAIKKYAGMLGFAVPAIKGIAFEGAGSGRAVFADGSKIALKTVGKAVVYLSNDAKMKEAVRIELDRMPDGLNFH